jgi:signal transduction histidine kinase
MKTKQHNENRAQRKHSLGLNLFLTFFIFLISTLTMILAGTIAFGLFHFHMINFPFFASAGANMLFFLAILSIAISTCISPFITRFPLRPIRTIIDAINELAKGNFDTRISLDYPFELKYLSESFNSLANELEHTTLLRNDFVNNFSHEFKTPIVSIKGFAKLLKDDSLPEEKKQEYLDIIIHEADRLATLSTKVLDLSKIEGQTSLHHIDTYNLSEQIRLSFLLLENKWSSKNIDFSIDLDEIQISANEEMMQQVFVNLLDNAIKFTPEGGFITLSLTTENDRILFRVKDTGIGMDEETLSHIFHKFYQSDSSHQQEGNGLGLALVKQIIDLHHGTIEVKSKPQKGTTVTVSLPCYR